MIEGSPEGDRPPRRPRKPRPGPRPVTEIYLQRAATHYLDRYGSSAENLRRVLERKSLRRLQARTLEGDHQRMIAITVAGTIANGTLDDAAYARSKASGLIRKGASARTISSKLRSKGIDSETAIAALPEGGIDEMAQAHRHAQRKRLGPYAAKPDRERRQREIASLARAGFPYRVAAAVIDGTEDD